MARDEDIFKKLKKETPLVKQRDLQPLSKREFTPPKTTLSIPVEYKHKRNKKEIRREPGIFTGAEEKSAVSKRQASETVSLEHERAESRAIENKQEALRDKPKIAPKTAKPRKLEVFADDIKPQSHSQENADELKQQKTYDSPIARSPQPQRTNVPARREDAKPGITYTPPTRKIVEEAAYHSAYIEDAAEKKRIQMRHELKFYINYRDYVMLKCALKALMYPDPYAGEDNSYHVRSLYFDDINDSALREKIAGSDNRCKYRIRIYNLKDDAIKFEKKFKSGQYVGKKSLDLTRAEYESIMAGDCDFLLDRNEELAKELFLEMKGNLLRPRVIVEYMREAYVSHIENCRITFDKDLKAGLMLRDVFDANAPVMPMYDSGLMVLEVKFNKYLPEYIKRVLNNINSADRCAISKYVICRKYE